MTTSKPWALITGANGGIGKALVNEFINEGYQVIATDIVELETSQVDNVVNIQLDLEQFVLDEQYAENFVSRVADITRGIGITSLINNAAVQILAPSNSLKRRDWQKSFNVNLSAPFFMIQAFLSDLENNKGSVVNISSIHATQTKKEFVAYATTKAGLSSLTRNLAIDIGKRVRMNAIEPAAVSTEMLRAGFEGKELQYKQLENHHPLERIAKPEEVAELAIFLCSEKSKFVHGACISSSGGIQGCLSDPSK